MYDRSEIVISILHRQLLPSSIAYAGEGTPSQEIRGAQSITSSIFIRSWNGTITRSKRVQPPTSSKNMPHSSSLEIPRPLLRLPMKLNSAPTSVQLHPLPRPQTSKRPSTCLVCLSLPWGHVLESLPLDLEVPAGGTAPLPAEQTPLTKGIANLPSNLMTNGIENHLCTSTASMALALSCWMLTIALSAAMEVYRS